MKWFLENEWKITFDFPALTGIPLPGLEETLSAGKHLIDHGFLTDWLMKWQPLD